MKSIYRILFAFVLATIFGTHASAAPAGAGKPLDHGWRDAPDATYTTEAFNTLALFDMYLSSRLEVLKTTDYIHISQAVLAANLQLAQLALDVATAQQMERDAHLEETEDDSNPNDVKAEESLMKSVEGLIANIEKVNETPLRREKPGDGLVECFYDQNRNIAAFIEDNKLYPGFINLNDIVTTTGTA